MLYIKLFTARKTEVATVAVYCTKSKKLANKKNLSDKIVMDPETLDLHYLNTDQEV